MFLHAQFAFADANQASLQVSTAAAEPPLVDRAVADRESSGW